MSNLNIFS